MSAPVVLPASVHPDHPDYTLERYDVRQAAVYLGRAVPFIYGEVAGRRIAYRRDNPENSHATKRRTTARIRFSQKDLDAWRDARRVEVKPKPKMVGMPGGLAADMPKVRRFS
jgi:hypothetical protein